MKQIIIILSLLILASCASMPTVNGGPIHKEDHQFIIHAKIFEF